VTHDTLNDRGQVSWFTGGGAYFAAYAARACGARVLVLTKMAAPDQAPLEQMRAAGIETIVLPSGATTSIENVFDSADVDRRRVRLLAQAEPFRLEELPEVEAAIYSLAALFRGEIPPGMIEPLARRGEVALDLQGVLRTQSGGAFSWQNWPGKGRYLPFITYLKADSLESEVITGSSDLREAAHLLHGWGAREVMITHSSEVILYDGQGLYASPFDPANLSGRTGRGDSCFGSYLSYRLSHGPEESLRYAAALTSIKMESPGPFSGSMAQVLGRMKGLGGK
jgi:sugar/nucleoside kinase (ribokinase family)